MPCESGPKSPSCPIVGGTHTNFKRVHAEHGQVFVVAASHLIFRFRQPLQARMTILVSFAAIWQDVSSVVYYLTLQSLVPIVFIHEHIVYEEMESVTRSEATSWHAEADILFWPSRGGPEGGANE